MSIVKKIKELAYEKDISIAALEREVGIANGAIYKWDKSSPTIDKLNKVAQYLNVSVDYLMSNDMNDNLLPDVKTEHTDIVNRIKGLAEEKNTTLADLERTLSLSHGSMQKWDTSSPSVDKVDKVAKYFNVSLDYLLGKTTIRGSYENTLETIADPRLNKKDKHDIAKKLEELENDLADYDATLMLSGEIMDDETRELLKASLANVVVIAKLKAKEKFNPNKNKNKDLDK